MAIIMPKEGGDFEKVPAGPQAAVCYRVIDLGTQTVEFAGVEKHQRKVVFSWELLNERTKDDKPFTISKRFTLSSSKKGTLRAFLESWRGLAFSDADFGTFDLGKLLGQGALLGIIHEEKEGKVYENITTVMKLPKGMSCSTPENEIIYFSLDSFDQALFDKFSEHLKKTISESPEYAAAVAPPPEALAAAAVLGGTVEPAPHF